MILHGKTMVFLCPFAMPDSMNEEILGIVRVGAYSQIEAERE